VLLREVEYAKPSSVADALALRPKVFPPIFVSMVHAGEQSGIALLDAYDPAEGIPIREETLHREDLMTADEVFITSTTRNLLPVVSIEGHPLSGRNQVRAALGAAFERGVERYTSYVSSLS